MRELWQQLFHPDAVFASETVIRLALAALLGGLIGLEREFKQKPAGLRTNMFICLGAAMFTLLSYHVAHAYGGDASRIASQIIPGIGFIGAGSILHSRGSVTGLTTAATIFMVASIGMAVGAGFYLPAIFATIMVGMALHFLAWVETRFSLKPLVMHYELSGAQADELLSDINRLLEDEHHMMQTVQVGRTDGHHRVHFSVEATLKEHDGLFERLRRLASASRVERFEPRPHE